MKKIRVLLICILLLSLCALVMTGCGSKLNAPKGLFLDVDTQTLHWNMVKSAKYYTVQISGQEQEITTKSNSISLEDLKPGQYEIKVRANGGGEMYDDSQWTVFQYTREEESGLNYNLINNGTAYELVSAGSASGDVVMEDVYRGKPVVSIAEKALYNNTKITSFTVGKNVKTIGKKAFTKCSQLTSVVSPEGVTTLGEYAFQSCKQLTTITLPDSITTILPHTFEWCEMLSNITIGKNVTAIYDYAFSKCESLDTITFSGDTGSLKATLPDTVQYIGDYAFADCVALSEIDLGANMQTIRSYAFSNCSALQSVDLGVSLQVIYEYAFSNCSAMTTVVIPDSTQALDDNVFRNCTMLSNVSLGSGLVSVGSYVFLNTAILNNAGKMLTIDGWLIQYNDDQTEKLAISGEIYGIASRAVAKNKTLNQVELRGVKYIGYAAFFDCEKLYKVTTDEALLEVGHYAFYECPFLEKVTLGENTQSIGNYAFTGCSKLKEMVIPASVTSIGTRAFRDTGAYDNVSTGAVYMGNWVVDYISSAGGFDQVKIEGNIVGIANYAFTGVKALYVTMPDSVKYICRGAFCNSQIFMINLPTSLEQVGDYAFYRCSSTSFGGENYALIIPDGTKSIGRSAFYECTYVLSLKIPGSVKTIGDYAFYGCDALGSTQELSQDTGKVDEEGNPIYELVPIAGYVILEEGIEHIGQRAFQNCLSIASITIPNSVTSMGERVFYNCIGLQEATVGAGLDQIPSYTFYKCAALEKVTVPSNVQSIGNYAFRGCETLNNLQLTGTVEIGRYAFYGCAALQQVTLPATLTSIGDYAFRGCGNLSAVVLPQALTTIGKHAFYGLNNTTLYSEAAQAGEQWNEYCNSSFRPVFWSCVVSQEDGYVVSVVVGKDTLQNAMATNGISDPTRQGYTFGGWATQQGSTVATYTSKNVQDAQQGTVLYAIWLPQGE